MPWRCLELSQDDGSLVNSGDLMDWGPIPAMIEGESHTSGRLLHKGPGGHPEAGLWVCTPGTWACEVTADEFCHFLAGRAVYTHEAGAVTVVKPGTAAFFPKGWRGTCQVQKTLRKVYMIA